MLTISRYIICAVALLSMVTEFVITAKSLDPGYPGPRCKLNDIVSGKRSQQGMSLLHRYCFHFSQTLRADPRPTEWSLSRSEGEQTLVFYSCNLDKVDPTCEHCHFRCEVSPVLRDILLLHPHLPPTQSFLPPTTNHRLHFSTLSLLRVPNYNETATENSEDKRRKTLPYRALAQHIPP